MKTIKDSVHDYIEVEGVALSLLDTPPLQRLRHVSQLGTVTLVYPSANHTRFEHSLGVYHLADQALSHLGIEGQQAERVRAAALLHDVGHGPYSHNVEGLIHRHTGKYHDDVHDLIGEGAVARVLTEHGLNPDAVADLIAGDGELGQLVSGELDVDRMDYLVRDAHHTGVPYGTIDHGRLVRELRFRDGELVLAEGNVQTAESLLLARALMTPTVYSHHVARIAKAMLRRASARLLEATDTDPETFRRMDDAELLVALRSTDETAEIGRRLTYRDLYKRAVWAERAAVPAEVLEMEQTAIREREREIAEAAGVDPAAVILDVPPEPSMAESSSRVLVNGTVRRLEEQSTLVRALQAAQRDRWRLGVYAPADVRERVGDAAVRTLDLDIEGARVSDTPRGIHTTLDEFE
ncbi:dGTPase protein [Halorhabdus tiamatea SARL4B]|uniref:DNTP triphosphohydrolase-like protein, archaeal subgroup n=1 Tax=Halorhabdus tiamatea SARL4B TaxID=1033806 RepID=F7PP36_9EURY|nr:HD domain-containing protein [Halorhabdus tiamatea]ERJ07176.1 dGTPase protein [Halorhabdus tiamatea SARL4B]CCQ32796.1 dNTP triphosphohydrolase-like protein, archaeal subgroup [Halorhabdus tiamatea SARL4B]